MRISGLVRAVNGVREELRRGIPPEDREGFRERVRDLIARVEMLCDEHASTPDDLPGPSRKAYRFLRELDLDDLPEATGATAAAPPPAPAARVAGVIGVAEGLARRLWRERDLVGAEGGAGEEVRELAASHAAAIEGIAEEQDTAATELPPRARRHYALLAWLARPGNPERFAAAMRRAGAALRVPDGEELHLAMVPMSSSWRWRRRGRRHFLKVSTAFLAAGEADFAALGGALGAGPGAEEGRRAAIAFVRSPAAVAAVREVDALAEPAGAAAGRVHDLGTSFSRVNLRFFGGSLDAPRLSWSDRITGRVFGRYRRDRDEVTVSQSLDDPDVPESVVDYVVYHELLHRVLGTEERDGRRRVHGPEFRRRERLFPGAAEAERHLEGLARRHGGA